MSGADPLQAALRPVAAVLNRQIEAKAPARALCEELDGRNIVLRVRDTALAVSFRIAGGRLSLSEDVGDDPDAVITGSLLTLLRLAISGDEDLIRSGAVDLGGDAEAAASFRELLRHARPDPEEELSRLVGDVAAHGIGEFARGIGNWSRRSRAILIQNVSEYLQEESGAVPSRYEVDRFRKAVEKLRDDAARFEARLKRFEQDVDAGDTA
ncbi:MAG: ubiquinone biosynthesis accessory factor UbiJ [Woeseiaceae bacterium]